MQTAFYATPPSTSASVELHQLVNRIVTGLLPKATAVRSFIINNVKRGTYISTDTAILEAVLSSLLYGSVDGGKSDCIHVSAKSIGELTLMYVKSNSSNYRKKIATGLYELQSLTEKLGGGLIITDNEPYGITIAFTFVNASRKKFEWWNNQ